MASGGGRNEFKRREDHNRAATLAAIRRLEQLLVVAAHPSFRGEISICLTAADGYLGRHKAVTTEFGGDPIPKDS